MLGAVTAIALSLSFLFFYFVVYKKLSGGKRTISPLKLGLFALFICYLTVIVGAVFLSRSDYIYRITYLQPLTLYREAWFTCTVVAWRNLVLNIAAFIPFGVLLPLLSEKFQKLWKTVGAGFMFSIAIESVQYLTGRGQASADDVINNTAGVLIGYGLAMAFLTIIGRTKIKPRRFFGYLTPLFATIFVFLVMFTVYQTQEFGNLSSGHYIKQNMTNVEISYEVELSEDTPIMHIFHVESFSKAQSREFAELFFERMGTAFKNERKPIIYDASAYYYSNDGILTVRYKGKTYVYTTFSSDSPADNSLTETQVRSLLAEHGVDVPENAGFINHGNGQYGFNTGTGSADQPVAGSLSCEILKDGTIKKIDNNLLERKYSVERNIISEKDAFKRIAEGKFHYGYAGEKLRSVKIVSVDLEYRLDSKGFYRPVYYFGAYINDNRYAISIPAL